MKFESSASKHGYTLDDVLYAVAHVIDMQSFTQAGVQYIKLVGDHHGDSLVPRLEIIMKRDKTGRIHVFHVNALQDNFMN
ncbi:hypothetical protein ACFQY8_03355 [Alloscardovia venturai]|uniref:Uncharacterized protein n=1 Tax=Alloscardovia venturai TaxID=1769421 RepID=A0ABW2Y602_9BIFI